jgi:PleD family two-component response regulator
MVTGENVGNTAIEAIRRGATDYVVKTGDYLLTIPLVVQKNITVAKVMQENESLRHELERALSEVRDKNAQLEASLQRVEELAATDPLTGLSASTTAAISRACWTSFMPRRNDTTRTWPA